MDLGEEQILIINVRSIIAIWCRVDGYGINIRASLMDK